MRGFCKRSEQYKQQIKTDSINTLIMRASRVCTCTALHFVTKKCSVLLQYIDTKTVDYSYDMAFFNERMTELELQK